MAARKAFTVKVELDVQAVTCPGVWLSSKGQVSLQIYMLDSCVQTSTFRPVFPMLFHEQFVFSKTLPAKYHLEDLNKQLSREWLYVELIQWEDCESGNVLAYFQIPLNELLYPNVSGRIPIGSEVDLLMEVTPAFPGTLAPKLEVSTKTTIDETTCTCVPKKTNTSMLLRPKPVLSCTGHPMCRREVCLSTSSKHSRNKKCKPSCLMRYKMIERPPWRYRRVDDGFLMRQPVLNLPVKPTPQLEIDGGLDGGPFGGPRRVLEDNSRSHSLPNIFEKACNIFRNRTQPDRGMEVRRILKESLRKALGQPVRTGPCKIEEYLCGCGHVHANEECEVCQKYSGIFSKQMKDCIKEKQVFCSTMNPDKSFYKQLMRQTQRNHEKHREEFPEVQRKKKTISHCIAHEKPSVCGMAYKVPEIRAKLSNKLHERISKTLNNIPGYLEDMKDLCCDIGDLERPLSPCTCERVPDMKKFYKELFHEEYKE